MPNYKSDNLTFLTVAEMTSMLVDNTDQEGLLFAVKTGATTFKMVMWIKDSVATVDNESVYPANGLGRWHVLANGSLAKLADVNVLNPTTGQALVFNGTKWANQTIAVGEMNIPELMVYDETLGSATPPAGAKLAVVNKVSGDELYVAKNDTWELLDIAGGDDTITFADLPTGTTSNTVAIGDHSHTLDNLSDVIITSPANGNIVAFNGTNWINQTPVTPATNLDALTDVAITSPASGQTLSFNGTNWINAVASGGGGDTVAIVNQSLPTTPESGKSIYIVKKWIAGNTGFLERYVSYYYTGSEWKVLSAEPIIETAGDSPIHLYPSPSVAVGAFTSILYFDLDENFNEVFLPLSGDTSGQMLHILGSSNFQSYMWINTTKEDASYNPFSYNQMWKRIS